MASIILLLLTLGQLADSLNMRSIGCWPYAPLPKGYGETPTPYCQVADSILYVAAGRGMYIFDVSNPAAVRKLDSFPTPGWLEWFSVSGNYCLTGQCKEGVALYDISDPRRPLLVNTYHPPWFVNESQLLGRHAFLIGDELRILDYTDPAHPVELGSCPVPEYSIKVEVSGNYAYVCGSSGGFIIIDISDLSNPFEVFRYQIPPPPTNWPLDIQVRDTFAYIGWEDAGMRVWNVKDPTAPFEVAVFPGGIDHLQVVDSFAFVINERNNAHESLYILNVADPARIHVLAKCRGDLCAVFGNRCYIVNPAQDYPTNDTVTILDVSNPGNPVVLSRFSGFHHWTEGISAQGNFVYTTNRIQGLKIFDVSDPSFPRFVSEIDSAWRLFRLWVSSDNIAYIAGGSFPGLRIFDVADPQNPVQIGRFDPARHGRAITVRETLAFLAADTNVWILNVADPHSPQLVAVIGSRAIPWDCTVAGNLLLIAYTYNGWGLRIYDITDPARPESLCFYDTQVAVSDVAVDFPYAFVVGSQFIVLDISNPREPLEVARLSVGDYCWQIDLDWNLGYVAQASNGVRVYDLSDPSAPVEVGFYVTPFWTSDIHLANDLVFVSDQQGWLILEYYGPGVEEKGTSSFSARRPRVIYDFTSQTLRIKLADPDDIKRLDIFNSAGIRVCSVSSRTSSSNSDVVVGHLSLSSGVYYLKLSAERAIYSTKFIVAR